jgi:integrase
MRTYGDWLENLHVMKMELPDESEPRRRRFKDEEIMKIIAEIKSTPMRAAILIGLLTSLRRAEVLSLQWQHVAFDRRTVLLANRGHIRSRTKTRSREVPLLPGAIKILQDLGPQKAGAIFSVSKSGLSQAWRRAADRVGAYDGRLHDCRREAISRLIEKCDLLLPGVMVFSGHSDLRTLQRHYVQLDPESLAAKLHEMPGAAAMLPLPAA